MDEDQDQVDEAAEPEEAPEAEAATVEPAEDSEPVVGGDGATVEAVGSGSGAKGSWVYECSAGDFHSRDKAATEAHIAAEHGKAKAAPKAAPKATTKPRTTRKR